MALNELVVIGDFLYDQAVEGVQAAGTLWQPSASFGNAEIDADEVAEIVAVEIRSPINAGVAEDLDQVYLVIDGTSTQNLVNMSGRNDISTNPDRRHVFTNDPKTQFVTFGEDIVTALKQPIPALANTTFKVSTRVRVITKAGAADVTQNYRVRIWGYKYTDRILERLPNRTMPGNFTIRDRRRDRNISVPFPSVNINREDWSLLPGGRDQNSVKINPWLRFATNDAATIANTRSEFRFDIGNVDDEFKDLRFEHDIQNRIFIAKGLGARAHANSRHVWFQLTGDPFSEERPKGRFPVTQNNNPIIFGHGAPQWPAATPIYYTIPQFAISDLIVYRDRGAVSMQDNGTPIPVDGVAVALYGILIDLGGKV